MNVKPGYKFKANGVTYKVLEPKQLPILRYNAYLKSGVQIGFHADFQTLYNNNRRSIELLEKYQEEGKEEVLQQLTAHLYALDDGLLSTSSERFDVAMQHCTTFIIAEEEELTDYVESEQIEKLENWNKAGLDPNFFFRLAMSSIPEWKNCYLLSIQTKMDRLIKLSELSKLRGTKSEE